MTEEQIENAEVGFDEWFNGNYGKFSCRSEWFYGDCEVKDEKIRKDLVYNWVRAAFLSGYELGGAPDELEETTMTEDIELYNPDEFIVNEIKMFHYEVMEPGKHIWAAFYLENGRIGHLNIFSNGGKLETRYEEWDKDL